jgi:transposase
MKNKQEIKEIISQTIGNGPVLKEYYEKMKLVETINKMVPPKGEGLSCGEAVGAMVAMVLNKGHALYAMEQWAESNQILGSIFTNRVPKNYNDDQLARCLDKMFKTGLKSIHSAISSAMCKGFSIEVKSIHHDTTSLSFYGAYDLPIKETQTQTQSQSQSQSQEKEEKKEEKAPKITYGYSRDKRPDLKQIIAAISVQQDGIPLLATTEDGNAADGPNYVQHWETISEMLGYSNFLYLGDTKLYSIERVKDIVSKGGEFLCPMPMSQKEQAKISQLISSGHIKFEDKEVATKKYGLWESSFEIIGAQQETISLRKIVVRSKALADNQLKSREERLKKVQNELQELKVNQYKLKSKCEIERAVNEIIERLKVKNYLNVEILEIEEIKQIKIGRGRPTSNTEYQEQKLQKFELKIELKEKEINQAKTLDGIYLLCCSLPKSQLSTEDVLKEYKGQNKVERGHRELKGPIALAPIFLHKPERVAAITLICVIALQLLRLMEFNAKNQLLLLKEKLSGLLPNHLSTSNPSAVKMLASLSTIDILEVVTSTDTQFFLNKLSPLQLKILQLLDIPLLSYSNFLSLAKFPNSG